MYLTVDTVIEINNIITGSNNFILRKTNVKPYGFDKIYMDKDLIEDKLYQLIYQFSERKITPEKFYSILLKKIIHLMIEIVERARNCLLIMKKLK